MANEIRILVRTQNSAKAGFENVNKELDTFARESSEKFSKTYAENMSKNLTETLTAKFRTIGDQTRSAATLAGNDIGETIGRRVTEKINERIRVDVKENTDRNGLLPGNGIPGASGGRDREHVTVSERVHVDVDVDKKTLMERLTSFGSDIKDKVSGFFNEGILSGFSSAFSGDVISSLIKTALIGFGISTLAPALGATVSSAVLLALGTGAIGLGVAGALRDPRIKTALSGIKGMLMDTFNNFSANFTGPLEDFLAPQNKGGGGIVGLFRQLNPMIEQLGKNLAPLAGQLGNGLIGFLQNLLPSIIRGMDAAKPVIEVLANRLPGLGDSIAKFFDIISSHSQESAQFFDDLLRFIGLVIEALGHLVGGLTSMYKYARTATLLVAAAFAEMARAIIDTADAALGWIPGWGPKFAAARKKVQDFEKSVNNSLKGINDKDINIRIHVWGLNTARALVDTTQQLKALGLIGRAAGGVVGAAASGGLRNGRTLVGEAGPELVDLPAGARVHTAGETQRMMSGGMGGGGLVAVATADPSRLSDRTLTDVLMRLLRVEIFNVAGGNVQQALGS